MTVAGTVADATIARTRSTASSSVALPLRRLNVLRRSERAVDAVEARAREPLVAALVQHEPGQLRCAALRRGDHLLRARHLRHAVVAHERDGLDPRYARGGEARDELGADGRRERVGLVLQPVARPDVADGDRGHAGAGAGTYSMRLVGRIGSSATTSVVIATPTHCHPVSVNPNLK